MEEIKLLNILLNQQNVDILILKIIDRIQISLILILILIVILATGLYLNKLKLRRLKDEIESLSDGLNILKEHLK